MIISILLALSCPKTEMVNVSGYEWNDHDSKTLEYTKKRCGEVYKDAPCVKLFRKWGKQDYSVICGAAKE